MRDLYAANYLLSQPWFMIDLLFAAVVIVT
jgi:hypothetical protein